MFKYVAILAFILPIATSRSVNVQKATGRKCSVTDGVVPERSMEDMTLFPRAIDPKGYRLNVVVIYDDTFAAQFKNKAEAEIKNVVAKAGVALKHESLAVKFQLDTMAIQHAKGSKWDGENTLQYKDECMKLAKANAIKDANNYVCIGGKPSGWAAGGVAGKGTVCDKNRGERVAYVQYVIQAGDTGMALKADQMSVHTAAVFAHEIGHTIGMEHDFSGMDQTNLKKNPSGKGFCKGHMDYADSTGGWSECSNKDLKKFLNGLKKNCLKPIGTKGTSTDWSEGTPEFQFPPGGDIGECKPPFCIMEP